MEAALIVLAVALVVVAGVIVWIVLRREEATTKEVDQRIEQLVASTFCFVIASEQSLRSHPPLIRELAYRDSVPSQGRIFPR